MYDGPLNLNTNSMKSEELNLIIIATFSCNTGFNITSPVLSICKPRNPQVLQR